MSDKAILYFCNGCDPECLKTTCYKRGGDCYHTSKEEYKLNSISIPKANGTSIKTTFKQFGDMLVETIEYTSLLDISNDSEKGDVQLLIRRQ